MRNACIAIAGLAVLLTAISSESAYIKTCHYYGPSCPDNYVYNDGNKIPNITPSEVPTPARQDTNVSCGARWEDNIEYCQLEEDTMRIEPRPGLFQCFSLYTHSGNDTDRPLALAGCIFGHELQLCTNHTCNLSHTIEKDEASSFHYCCCHGLEQCNAQPIMGWPASTPPTSPTSPSGTTTTEPEDGLTVSKLILVILLPVVACCILILAITCCWVSHKRKGIDGFGGPQAQLIEMDSLSRPEMPFAQGELIVFHDDASIIGRGRFSSVRRGTLDGEEVAIKVFTDQEETAWKNEWMVYNTLRIQHENILYFRGVQEMLNGMPPQRYIVTEYHPNGSLSDYLKRNTVDFNEMHIKARSIGRGLEFLHTQRRLTELSPPPVKPTIAHRDLKSKNILVKLNGECCVSDFGLAASFPVNENMTERQGKVGTTRYMAPEVLEGAITFQMESFLRIDIYAFALVLWELIVRCNFNGVAAPPYREPFFDEVGPNASQQSMLRVVVTRKDRPKFPAHCANHPCLNLIIKMVAECWDPDPEARLSAQCFLDNLSEIINDPALNPDGDGDQLYPMSEKPRVDNREPSAPPLDPDSPVRPEYDQVVGHSGSTSGPPPYSSGNYGHDGVPNIQIRNNDYFNPPQYAPVPRQGHGNHGNGLQPNGPMMVGNGGPHYQNYVVRAHDAAVLSSMSSSHGAPVSSSDRHANSNGHVANGGPYWGHANNSNSTVNRPTNVTLTSSSQIPVGNGGINYTLAPEASSPSRAIQESSL